MFQIQCISQVPTTVISQVRLVEEDASYTSYGEAYEVNCARYGREPDAPIVHFKKRICDPSGQLQRDVAVELRQQVGVKGSCVLRP